MYVWIWRHLPGRLMGKLVGCLLLLAVAVSLLFFVVFPWAEQKLPFNNVNVAPHSTSAPRTSGG